MPDRCHRLGSKIAMMKWILTIWMTCFTAPVFAQLAVSALFEDHMVLQRNQPIRVHGKGSPNQTVSVRFNKQSATAIIGKDSSWIVVLGSFRASREPQQLVVIAGTDTIIRKNILVGDVWICTGQSNMEWAFSRDEFASEESPQAEQPLIRLYNTSFAGKYVYGETYTDSILQRVNTTDFYKGNWQTCTPETVQQFSAIGYYFAKKITAETGIPVGLINLAIGGAPIETFISRQAFENDPAFKSKLHENWLYNSALPGWIRERGLQNVGHLPEAKDQYSAGPDHAYKPGFAFASSIPQLSGLPVAGILLYQGESNSLEIERVREYGSLLQLMAKDYRKQWKQENLPFYWVQLSSIDTPGYKSQYWPAFRDIQRACLDSIPNSGMAVSSDIGNPRDVHPRNKRTVGYRLAAWALHHQYGVKKIVPSGPLLNRVSLKKNSVVLRFKYASSGFSTSDHQPVRGFSFDGKTALTPILKRKKIILPFDSKPDHVFYGWEPFSTANLINNAGFPASTFYKKIN